MSKRMTKRDKKALMESIYHWQDNVRVEKPYDAEIWSEDCALCDAHLSVPFYKMTCGACPIKQHTGLDACEGSPWRRAQQTLSEWKSLHVDASLMEKGFRLTQEERERCSPEGIAQAKKAYIDAAYHMLGFLYTFVPKEDD